MRSNVHFANITVLDRIKCFILHLWLRFRGTKSMLTSTAKTDRFLSSLSGQDYTRVEPGKLKNHLGRTDRWGDPVFIISPKGRRNAGKKVIYITGGQYMFGAAKKHFSYIDSLVSATDATYYIVTLPTIPDYGVEDAYGILDDIYRTILTNTAASDITIMGDDTGATAALCFAGRLPSLGLPAPAQLICYSPLCDPALENEEIWQIAPKDPVLGVDGLTLCVDTWLGDTDMDSPEVNPMSIDPTVLPRTTVFCGTKDLTYPDTVLFCENAAQVGADVTLYQYDGMAHGFEFCKLSASELVKNQTIALVIDRKRRTRARAMQTK